VIQADVGDVVIADLRSESVLHGVVAPPGDSPVHGLPAGDEAMVGLLDLIAALGIFEVVREVRKQVQIVADAVRRDLGQ
jgi:hypothetical protein